MIFTFLSRQLNSVQCCQGCAVSALFFEYVSDVCCALSSGLARWRLGEFCNLNIDPSPPNHHDLDPRHQRVSEPNLETAPVSALRKCRETVECHCFCLKHAGGSGLAATSSPGGELKQFDLIKQSSAFNMSLQKR